MYIAIEGVIGVGKTTLARLIHEAFEADVLLEVFEENPFLGSFYADRQRYAFQTQIFFLMSRFTHQHQVIPSAMSAGRNIVSDYTFDKDALFAEDGRVRRRYFSSGFRAGHHGFVFFFRHERKARRPQHVHGDGECGRGKGDDDGFNKGFSN